MLPAADAGLHIWDTPTPPPLAAVAFMRKHTLHVTPASYMHVVDLSAAVTGLSFLCTRTIDAIHAHTAAAPSAAPTAARMLPPGARPTWQYMPLAPGDRIEAVGVRKDAYSASMTQDEMTIMVRAPSRADCLGPVRTTGTGWAGLLTAPQFRKRLSGDSLVGFSFYDAPTESILTRPAEQPRALVYSSRIRSAAITDVGIYHVPASPDAAAAGLATAVRGRTRRRRFTHSAWPDEQITDDAFQSNVPLAGATHVRVYTSRTTGLTRGLVLTYGNGAQRALGMCCVGTAIDSVRDYDRPVRLCFTCKDEDGETRLRVVTEADGDGHDHGDDGEDDVGQRTCCLMAGRLEYAVASDKFSLVHFAAEEEPDGEMDSDAEDQDIW